MHAFDNAQLGGKFVDKAGGGKIGDTEHRASIA